MGQQGWAMKPMLNGHKDTWGRDWKYGMTYEAFHSQGAVTRVDDEIYEAPASSGIARMAHRRFSLPDCLQDADICTV
jgi:hypothetical protein